jgi:hypothetical protein
MYMTDDAHAAAAALDDTLPGATQVADPFHVERMVDERGRGRS